MAVTALCPGTFDPVTGGHLDVIERASRHFDTLIAAVLQNPAKEPLFTLDERVAILKEAVADMGNVEVDSFAGLLVEYAQDRGATVVVKGLRAVSDFEYELQMAHMNRHLSDVETFFVMSDPQWSYVSSSLIKEVAGYGGDVRGLLPDFVHERLMDRLGSREGAS
ncbi:MAG: pantetheine-phosphate adenylyltransferase [Actinomycetota bacterium]